MRRSKSERIGGKGEAAAHRRWRNWPKALADTAESGDELRRPGGANWQGCRGGLGRRGRLLIGEVLKTIYSRNKEGSDLRRGLPKQRGGRD
jgi:hypothetical protein